MGNTKTSRVTRALHGEPVQPAPQPAVGRIGALFGLHDEPKDESTAELVRQSEKQGRLAGEAVQRAAADLDDVGACWLIQALLVQVNVVQRTREPFCLKGIEAP